MQKFNNYLESKRIVPEKQIPFYVNWVSQFLNFFNKKPSDNFTSDEIARFLKYLTKRKEEWQVSQASESIRIYQFYQTHKNNPATTKNNDSSTQWKAVTDEMINILRPKTTLFKNRKGISLLDQNALSFSEWCFSILY